MRKKTLQFWGEHERGKKGWDSVGYSVYIIEIVFSADGSISFKGPLRKWSLKWSFKWKRSLHRSGKSSIIITFKRKGKS